MRQAIIGGADNALNNSVAEYTSLCGGWQWHATQSTKIQIVPMAGTFSRLLVEIDGIPGSGKTWTFTLMKNGVATGLTLDIAGSETTASDTTNSAPFAAGDTISLRATSSGSPTNRKAKWACSFTGTDARKSILLSSIARPTKDADKYHLLQGTDVSGNENYAIQVIPTVGTLKNLFVKMSQAPGSGSEAYSYTLRVNNVSKALTCTITGASTWGTDTTNEVAVVAGDRVALLITPLNSPANSADAYTSMTFQPRAKGESIIMGGQPLGTNTETYASLQHNNQSYSANETLIHQEILSGYVKNLYVWLASSAGGGNLDITLRKNGADTALTVNIAGGVTGWESDTTHEVTVSNGDEVSVRVTPNDSPSTLAVIKWSVVHISGDILPSRAITRLTGIRHRFSAGRKKSRTKGKYDMHGVLGGISVFTDYQRRIKLPTTQVPWTPRTPAQDPSWWEQFEPDIFNP